MCWVNEAKIIDHEESIIAVCNSLSQLRIVAEKKLEIVASYCFRYDRT